MDKGIWPAPDVCKICYVSQLIVFFDKMCNIKTGPVFRGKLSFTEETYLGVFII